MNPESYTKTFGIHIKVNMTDLSVSYVIFYLTVEEGL